jgi:hypothetical protein
MRKTLIHRFRNSGSEVEEEAVTPSAFGADTIFFFDAARSASIYQEINATGNASATTGVPLNISDTDNDLVGYVYDLGPNALTLTNSASSATRPTLKSDGIRSSYFEFTGAHYLFIQNSTVILRPAFQASPVWGIMIWIKKGLDGTLQTVLSSSNGSASQRGFHLSLAAANKVLFRLCDGDGSLMANHTTTAGVAVADGWTPIMVYVNGTGTTGRITVGNNSEESFSISGGVTNSATNNLYFGARPDASEPFTGGIAQVIMLNRVITAGEWTNWKAFNPTRSSVNFRTLAYRYDFTDITTQWSDASATVQATVNGSVNTITNDKTSNFGTNPRSLQQTTAANQGVHRSNVVNSQAALELDGSNDNYNLLTLFGRGGSQTIYIAYINQDQSLASNIIDATYPSYASSAGELYDPPNAYVAWHFDVSLPSDVVSVDVENANQVTIIALRTYGEQRTIFNYSGASNSTTTTKKFEPVNFGRAANGDASLYMDGYYLLIEDWHGHETDSQVIAHMQEIGEQFGL